MSRLGDRFRRSAVRIIPEIVCAEHRKDEPVLGLKGVVMAKQNERPTLATVAARAGVSIKTASRVLNGEKHVARTTAQKVDEAAAELGFRLNPTAKKIGRASCRERV